MLKALAWKEWREQRPVVVAGVAISAVLPFFVVAASMLNNDGRLDQIVEVLPVAFMAGWWPLLAAASGAITIANEEEGGTIRFLLSRPVSRINIWLVKVSLGMLAVGTVAAFSLFVVWLVNRWVPPEASVERFAMLMGSLSSTIYDPIALTSLSILLFSCAVFCSSLLNRTLTAAAAGLALALILLSGVMLVWASLSLDPTLEPQWAAFEVMLLSAGVLLASLVVFAWAELFGGPAGAPRGARGAGRPLFVAAGVIALCVAGLPMVLADAVPVAGDLTVDPASVSFDGRAIAMTMVSADESTTQVWLLYPDASGSGPLTGLHTLAPTPVPGKAWVAYLSRRGMTGRRGGGLDLRVARLGSNAGEDWLVYQGMPGVRQLFFKGFSYTRFFNRHKVAFANGAEITVARLDGRGSATYDVGGTPLENAVILGFTGGNDEDELLFLPAGADVAARGEKAATTLSAYELESGTTRVVRDLAEGWFLPVQRSSEGTPSRALSEAGWERMPVITISTSPALELIDVLTSESWVVQEFGVDLNDAGARREFERCGVVEMPASRQWARPGSSGGVYGEEQILFGDCTERARAEAVETFGDAAGVGLIRLRGLETGDERIWPLPAGWEGSISRVFLDQGQQKVLLDIRTTRGAASYAMAIDQDGTARTFPPGWIALGWIDREWLLLKKEESGSVFIARASAASGEVRGLYPTPGEVIR